MDWLELFKYIAGLLPSWVLGVITVIAILAWMNKDKRIPLEISWGKRTNGKTYITVDEMKANCEKRQRGLDVNLNIISSKLDKISERQVDHGERIAGIEGELKGRYSHHRAGE